MILRRDQPPLRRTQLLDETDVPKDQARLRREVADQAFLRGVHRVVGWHRDREGPEELAPVADLDDGLALDRRQDVVRDARDIRGLGVRRPRGSRAQLGADAEPHTSRAGARGLAEDLRHPAEDVLRGIRLPDAFGELGQHLVRGRPPAVDDAIGDAPREPRHRPEREPEHQRDDEHGAGALVAGGDHAQESDDGRVRPDHEQDERARDERLLHDDVEVVQVVLQDGDRHGDGQRDERDPAHDRVDQVLVEPDRAGDRREEEGGHEERERERDPLDLLPFDAARSPEPQHQRRDAGQEQADERDAEHGIGDHRGVRWPARRTGSRRSRHPSSR